MLTDIVNTYLSVRRAVGFKLYTVEKYLWSYANFATARGDIRVLSTTAVGWAALASSENQRANRLKVLIRFARFARAENSGHEIPPDNIFCSRCNRRTPYIFTDEEVKQLILHATRLGPLDSLRPHTYSTFFGLLASTGLRISEALSLRFQALAAELEAEKIEPWLCEVDIELGANFVAKIEEGLREADLAVLFWSPEAARSGWTRLEWTSVQVVYIDYCFACSEKANQEKQNIQQHKRRTYVRNAAYSNRIAMLMLGNVGS